MLVIKCSFPNTRAKDILSKKCTLGKRNEKKKKEKKNRTQMTTTFL